MNTTWVIEVVDHRTLDVASKINAVQQKAYAAEAEMLGATHFPPLERTVADILATSERFTVARTGEVVIGSISIGDDGDGEGIAIASLTVDPSWQRQGIATALLSRIVAEYGGSRLVVRTGARNHPALELYSKFGFIAYRRFVVDEDALELIELRRPPDGPVMP